MDSLRKELNTLQGSDSLASWQANLLFEPVPFEDLDVLVHRGIYEAAKGIYEQMLPEVHAHLNSRGKHRAFLRFSGHSLGGSLSLLVNLMLLIRGQVPASSLLPVITFGSPCIMCGGDRLLQKLGLPKSHLLGISMHRDIVPRAFSCNYPNRAAKLLKALNGNFRNHPCLNNQVTCENILSCLLQIVVSWLTLFAFFPAECIVFSNGEASNSATIREILSPTSSASSRKWYLSLNI